MVNSGSNMFAGRYRLLRELGRGGMGIVHLAHDAELNVPLALKVYTESDAHSALWLKHEFRVVAALRHRHLARFYDLVVNGGNCFFTMEYIDGPSAMQWCRNAGTGQVDFARVEQVLLQLAAALQFLHEHHIVHRDVKPANVLVTQDEGVKLLDFGVALRPTGDVPVDELVGTVQYLAPEHLQTLQVGTGLDMYALGVLAFELCTGDVPFDGTLEDIQHAHANAGCAPRAGAVNPAVPPLLDAVIAQLLEFDPAQRLTAAEVSAWLDPAAVINSSPSTRAVGRPMVGRLVGRELEMTRIEAALAAPTRMIVVGSPGVGKATLLDHAIAKASDDACVWRGRCQQNEFVPYGAFDGVAEALVQQVPERITSALATVFGTMYAHSAVAALPGPWRTVRAQAHIDFATALVAVPSSGQRVVVLEEVQWADADSLALLRVLWAEPALSVIITVAVDADLPLPAALALMQHEQACVRLDVRALPAEQQAAQVRQLMPQASAAAVSRVVEMAAGSPLLAELYADESLFQSQLPTVALIAKPSARVGLSDEEVDIQDATCMRIGRLGQQARTIADWMAVATLPVGIVQLSELSGLSPLETLGALRLLQDARVARAVKAADGRVRFAMMHSRVNDSLYRVLSARRKVKMHRAIAQWYVGQHDDVRFTETIAAQLCASDQPADAAAWCARAAEQAYTRYAIDSARYWYARALVQIGLAGVSAEMAELRTRIEIGHARCHEAVEHPRAVAQVS